MENILLGKTGLKVSKVSLGTMNFGNRIDKEMSFQILDKAYKLGINCLDTANIYGPSESILGEWFNKTKARDEFIISSKVGWPISKNPNDQGYSDRHIRRQIKDSLNKLKSGNIDIYQAHGLDQEVKTSNLVRIFSNLKDEGLITIIGAPVFCKAWKLIEWHYEARLTSQNDIEFKQFPYSLISRGMSKSDLFDICQFLDIPMMGFGVLGGGLLTGKYSSEQPFPKDGKKQMIEIHKEGKVDVLSAKLQEIALNKGVEEKDIALSWALQNSRITSVFIGASNPFQLEGIVNSLDIGLSCKETQALTELSDMHYIF